MKTNRLLRIDEVCELLSFSRSSIYNMINDGKLIAPIKIGRASRWRLSDVDAFIDGQMASNAFSGFVAANSGRAGSMTKLQARA